MSNNKSGIYCIFNTKTGKVYVGSARNFKSRVSRHWHSLVRGEHHSKKLQRSWNVHGEDAFEFVILEYVEKHEDLITREQYWMDAMDSYEDGYNSYKKADSPLGMKHTPEAIKKMSDSKKNPSPERRAFLSRIAKGRKSSPETRKKISEANMGRSCSEETRNKIGAANGGKKREKISAWQLGRKLPEQHKKSLKRAWKRRHFRVSTLDICGTSINASDARTA